MGASTGSAASNPTPDIFAQLQDALDFRCARVFAPHRDCSNMESSLVRKPADLATDPKSPEQPGVDSAQYTRLPEGSYTASPEARSIPAGRRTGLSST